MLSRLTPAKGVDVALQALRLVRLRRPEQRCALVVAGEGYEETRLKGLSESLFLRDSVRFLGFVEDTHSLVAAYDVILFSSRVEGLPLGLLEGMAAGCLPIVTRVSGMPEVVDTRVGWVVAPDDPEALAEAMEAALTMSTESRRTMQQNAIQRVREHFDVDESYRTLVRSILPDHGF
jgi:glycosyltransferase involved in cell wall biosynthesis